MKSNFYFMTNKWPQLANIGEFAEKSLYTDPNTTLIKLRLLAEKIAKLMMNYEGIQEYGEINQAKRLKILDNRDFLPFQVKEIFHTLRVTGNRAIHDGIGSEKDAEVSLSLAQKLSAWFNEVYGDDRTFKAENVTFVTPERIDIKAEYEKLKKEHEAVLKDFEKYKIEKIKGKGKKEREEIDSSLQLSESETRKIIDEKLRKMRWEADTQSLKWPDTQPQKGRNMAIAEWPIGNKQADYALFTGLNFVGIVEAKRKSIDVRSALEQAKNYSKLATIKGEEEFPGGPWGDYKIPFVFSTNGRPYYKELETKSGIWFQDVRKKTNHPAALRNWYSPEDLQNLLEKDVEQANAVLREETFDYLESPNGLNLRYYQVLAIKAIEHSIKRGNERILLSMATGTGKTRTAIALIYRFIKSKRFKRVLFLVDRNSLGKQARDKFTEAKIEDLRTFDKIYDIKLLKDKFPEEETKVHIATVQGMVRRVLYHNDDDPMPSVGQYDCVIIDEAHRGYILDKELDEDEISFKDQKDYLSKYKYVIEYFNAVKIGLTATPALHTTRIFGEPVFSYGYRQAVIDGYLVDHEPPFIIQTFLGEEGIGWRTGEELLVFNQDKNEIEKTTCEDDINIEIDGFNKLVITENFNRVVVQQLIKYLDPYDQGKTLVFAANDGHADLVVKLLIEEYKNDGLEIEEGLIKKITGYVDDQEEDISKFKNEKEPNIVVTVDLLTTGIDVQEICNLVFIRRVRSRILYEQMLGRATRLCDRIGKEVFKIYDAVGLYEVLSPFTDMKPVVVNPKRSYTSIIEELDTVKNNKLKKQLLEEVIARLQGIKKRIERSDKLDHFKRLAGGRTPSEYIDYLKSMETAKAVGMIKRNRKLFTFLDRETFIPKKVLISQHEDQLLSVKRGYGKGKGKPGDYLEEFKDFVSNNRDKISALNVLCTRPQAMDRSTLKELRLVFEENGYTEAYLNQAWRELKKEDILADIIAFIRHAALDIPLISHSHRIKQAVSAIRDISNWDQRQSKWIDRIEEQLLRENTISAADFDNEPFKTYGGFERINRIMDDRLNEIVELINENLYPLCA